ncbi:hypothetical protein V1478_004728 [Vespula squamosa]|uniref:Uncharacterized protein n=1 Tax=Vespula squamosa TaxID=30214 RepID=A0ABD2BHC8_VESSQ
MTLKNKLNQIDDVSFLLATLESGPAGCSRLIVEHGNSSFFDVLQIGKPCISVHTTYISIQSVM